MSRGRYPFANIFGVRDTTRRVAASFDPRTVLTRASARSSLQGSADMIQEEVTHVEAPEEPPTILTRLASEPPNPLADLESLLPVRHTFDDEDGFIALCNDLLVLNSQEHRDPTLRTIKIPGTSGVYISPNQLYHAHHLLSQRGRDLNGGILADEAGTGKTYVYFAACLLRALAFESQRSVRLYWKGKGKKKVGKQAEHHLPEGANGRSCPSQKPGGIVCYCVPGSLTRTICDHTPSGVNVLYCATETWPDILNMVQTAGLSPSMYQLCLVHNNAPTRFTRPMQPLVETLSRGAQPNLKNFSPASYIFITTLNSPRLRNVFSGAILNAGFAVIDEAHQILRTKDSLTLRMASEFSDNGADVWFASATPFSGCTLADWIAPMRLIDPRRVGALRALDAALQTAKSSGDLDDARYFQSYFQAVFDKNLVVRHFGTSKFLGKSISDVQDIVPQVISRYTPLQHRVAVQELANQIAYKDPLLQDPGQRGLLYLVSLFPAAAELILDDPITFDTASIRDLVRQVRNRLRIEESAPLRKLADQIVKDSPKLDYILEELDRMGQDKRERERIETHNTSRFGAGEDLKMKKMVIITPTVVSAVFLYLALIRHRSDVSLIHNWVSAQEKEQTVNNFKSLSAAKLVKHSRVLIAPFAAIGTGANLQVASYEILTSPLPDKASQVQAFARTNRSGQRLRPLSHKILALEDSPVDRIMLASHATLEIESDPFNINEQLRIAGEIPLGGLGEPTVVLDDQLSSSHGSNLGVDDGLLFQTALPFSPHLFGNDDNQLSQEKGSENGSKSSFMDGDEALLLQEAMVWAPGSGTEDDGQDIGGAEEEHHQHGLLNNLSTDMPLPSTTGRQDETERSTRAFLENDNSFALRQLTQTLASRHLSMPPHDIGHRPLPPLPTNRQLGDQNVGPRRGQSTLFPPLPSGPPARIDAGPTLASRPDPFVSATPPTTRYHDDFNWDNFDIGTSDPSSRSPEVGTNSRDDSPTLGLLADFPSPPDQTTAVEEITRRETDSDQQQGGTIAPAVYDNGPFWPTDEGSPIERPPTPYPEEWLENQDDVPNLTRDAGNLFLDVEDLIRLARMRS